LTKEFVTKCKGLEKVHHSTKTATLVQQRGLGLYQQSELSGSAT